MAQASEICQFSFMNLVNLNPVDPMDNQSGMLVVQKPSVMITSSSRTHESRGRRRGPYHALAVGNGPVNAELGERPPQPAAP